MATIKEMAEDYSFIAEGTDATGEIYKDYNSNKYEGFIAGAKYVLECIENLLKDKNTGLVEMWDELMTLVEQLKGE